MLVQLLNLKFHGNSSVGVSVIRTEGRVGANMYNFCLNRHS